MRCDEALERTQDIGLAVIKPRWSELTDTGPGVSVTNFDVKVRAAEMCHLWNLDYYIRLHRRARGKKLQEIQSKSSFRSCFLALHKKQFRKVESVRCCCPGRKHIFVSTMNEPVVVLVLDLFRVPSGITTVPLSMLVTTQRNAVKPCWHLANTTAGTFINGRVGLVLFIHC